MATRVIPPRILRNLRYNTATKPLDAAHTSLPAAVVPPYFLEKADQKQQPCTVDHSATPETLNLNDGQTLFSRLPTNKLLRSSAILHATALGPMVDFGMWILRSKLMEIDMFKDLVLGITKRTFYEHFCAGEDDTAAAKCVASLTDAGLRGMLVYGVEDAHDNEACDRNFNGFMRAVDLGKSLPPSSVSYVVVKITAICPMRLLERMSDLLRWQQKDPSFSLPWKQNTLPIFSESSPLYHTQSKPQSLTSEEEHDLQLATQRLQQLCENCAQANIPLSIDAEHTTVQPAIDYFTYSSAISYNKDDNPIVFGTLQTYLKDAKERLLLTMKAAEKMGIPLGFKLVRGAYMSMESTIATSLGHASPIHNCIEDTHKCFNDCAYFMLEKIANGPGALVVATHNIESGKLAAAKAHDIGITRVNHKLEFAQLYGMSEALSLGLSNAGFQVSKYMTYGPVDMVMPYLLRRAEENRGFLAASGFDRQIMREELKRRFKAAVF